MREVVSELLEWSAAGEELALATVVETWGSSPRPAGSRFLVSRSGRMAGSVSNGCVEGAVVEEAERVLAAGRPRLASFGVPDDLAFEVGLACGGHLEVFIQPVAPVHLELATALLEERPVRLKTDLRTGRAELLRGLDGSPAGAWRTGEVFLESFPRPAEMVIVGASHVAIPLQRLAKLLGQRVTVVDARARFATRERFAEADRIILAWPDEALAGLALDASSAVVILTHDPKFDLPALRSALKSDAGYIGAIGSRRTNAERLAKLRAEGFTEAQLERIHGPIGLDLGGRSAEETALAILAEVVAVRHGAAGGSLRGRRGGAAPDAQPA